MDENNLIGQEALELLSINSDMSFDDDILEMTIAEMNERYVPRWAIEESIQPRPRVFSPYPPIIVSNEEIPDEENEDLTLIN